VASESSGGLWEFRSDETMFMSVGIWLGSLRPLDEHDRTDHLFIKKAGL
jgi:hypothetical protein